MNGGTARATVYAVPALVAALVAGGAAGYALGRQSLMKRPGPSLLEGGSRMSLLGVTHAAITDSLELSSTQRALVDSLLDDAERRAQSAVDTLIAGVRASTSELKDRVRAVLDERQQARFESLLRSTTPLLPRTPVPPRP